MGDEVGQAFPVFIKACGNRPECVCIPGDFFYFLLLLLGGKLFERVFAGEVDAALLVDLGDLDPGHVADIENVLDLFGALVQMSLRTGL